MKLLLPVAWTLFAIEVLYVCWAAIFVAREMGRDAQERATTGVFGVLALLALLLVGGLLAYAQKNQSLLAAWVGLSVALLPAIVWAAQRGSEKFSALDRERSQSRSIQFDDPRLTAMSAAIERTDLPALRELLSAGAPNWTMRNRGGQTLFGQAIAHVIADYSGATSVETVRVLMESGARADVHDLGPDRLLMPAVLGANTPGSEQLLDLVLQAGGDPNAADNQDEPLIHLVECTLPKLKILVRHKVDLRALSRRLDRKGWTVLMTAATLRDWDRVEYLLEQGVPTDTKSARGETFASVLHEVAQNTAASGEKLDPRLEALLKR